MKLKNLAYDLSICKIRNLSSMDLVSEFCFLAKTDEELSLVCKTSDVPVDVIARDDGRRGFRIEGMLDFSLIGILSEISTVLANNEIGIFAVSTYNTDYILVKAKDYDHAINVLESSGYEVGL